MMLLFALFARLGVSPKAASLPDNVRPLLRQPKLCPLSLPNALETILGCERA